MQFHSHHSLKAAIWAGVIAGTVMLILEMALHPIFLGVRMWVPIRMIGAILLGSEVLTPPDTFDAGVLLTAMLVHFSLSVIYAIVTALAIRNMPLVRAVLAGASIGIAIYLMNFYGFTVLFPWFAEARDWVQIVIHFVYGVVSHWSFNKIYNR
jgi:hypothetical protein